MASKTSRPLTGAAASLPLAVGLVGLFFCPWVELSCSPQAMLAAMPDEQGDAPPGMSFQDFAASAPELTPIGQASGWQLARGEMSPARDEETGEVKEVDQGKGPEARPWLYFCLALPVAALAAGGLALGGVLSVGTAGKILLVAGVAGAGLVGLASQTDYCDDILGQSACPIAAAKAKPQMEGLIRTEATPYLWTSLGLYGLLAVCGLSTLGVASAEAERWHTAEAGSPLDRGVQGSPQANGLPPGMWREGEGQAGTAVPAGGDPMQDRRRRPSDELPSFGEDVNGGDAEDLTGAAAGASTASAPDAPESGPGTPGA